MSYTQTKTHICTMYMNTYMYMSCTYTFTRMYMYVHVHVYNTYLRACAHIH